MNHEEIKKRLYDIRDEMVPPAKELLSTKGELTPVVFALAADGNLVIIGTTFADLKEKRAVYAGIGKLIREQYNAVGAVLLNESWWYVESRKPNESEDEFRKRDRVLPVNHPERREAIVATLCTFGWTRVKTYPFHRKDGRIVWEASGDEIEPTENTLFPVFATGIH